jgi:N-methylhydantoinase A
MQLGVDIGGTFTDAVVTDDQGNAWPAKVPSTTEPRDGFMDALEHVLSTTGQDPESAGRALARIMYGTTIATNIAVQKTGARVGLLATKGFGDAILIMQGHGYAAGVPDDLVMHIQALEKPEPIVPRDRIREITERIDAKGHVVVPLDEDDARQAVRELIAAGVDAFAVCFLWSFANGDHERRMREIIAEEAPDAFVTVSGELAPRAGEYTRTVATVINAYTGPAVAGHVHLLEQRLAERGVRARLNVVHCGGGVFAPEEASGAPVRLIGSGPVSGVLASRNLGAQLGQANILTTDMGGTTFDVGMIVDGQPISRSTSIVGQYEYMVPTVDIQSIGSGGGSIVWVDEASRSLRVGPHSAGSNPGPACYGRGGHLPTVTDCDLVVGYLNPDNFLGGQLKLDLERAADAIEQHVARPLGLSVVDAARGALRVVDAQMAELIRQMTVARGHDPREFVIFAFGGAGPLHAPYFSQELGASRVIVPGGALASVWSAYGAVTSDTVLVLERAHAQREPLSARSLEDAFLELEAEARTRLDATSAKDEPVEIRRYADLRYGMQVHVVQVPVPDRITDETVGSILDRFHRQYEQLFGAGTGFRSAGVDMASIRVEATVRNASRSALSVNAGASPSTSAGPGRHRPVHWPGEARALETPIVGESDLRPGTILDGPTIIELSTTTIPLPPGWRATIDATGSILLSSPGFEDTP